MNPKAVSALSLANLKKANTPFDKNNAKGVETSMAGHAAGPRALIEGRATAEEIEATTGVENDGQLALFSQKSMDGIKAGGGTRNRTTMKANW